MPCRAAAYNVCTMMLMHGFASPWAPQTPSPPPRCAVRTCTPQPAHCTASPHAEQPCCAHQNAHHLICRTAHCTLRRLAPHASRAQAEARAQRAQTSVRHFTNRKCLPVYLFFARRQPRGPPHKYTSPPPKSLPKTGPAPCTRPAALGPDLRRPTRTNAATRRTCCAASHTNAYKCCDSSHMLCRIAHERAIAPPHQNATHASHGIFPRSGLFCCTRDARPIARWAGAPSLPPRPWGHELRPVGTPA